MHGRIQRERVNLVNQELNMDWEFPERFYFPRRDPNLPPQHEFIPGRYV